MKINIKALGLMAGAALFGVSALAQTTYTGYFNDQYLYRFEMNPAFGNDKNFVSMPALGNINIGFNGTLKVSDVIYNVDGKTTTFLNPGVSVAEAMNNIGDGGRLGGEVKINIFNMGFKKWGGYNTIGINAKTSFGAKMPGELFEMLKEGISNRTYDITRTGAFGTAYGEIALGHSHDLNKEWRVGATMKFYIGGANIDAKFNQANLTLGEDQWTVTSDAQINANVKGLRYKTDVNDHTGHHYVSGLDVDDTGLNGFGMGLDLGAVYKPMALPGWIFSAALLDFGFISWKNNVLASTNGAKTFTTDKYTFNVDDDAPNSFDHEWDRISDDLAALYELDDMGDQGSQSRMVAATLNLGAEWQLTSYKPLTFGLVNTTRINGKYSWTDFRLSANIAPVKCFSASTSMGVGTFGASFGMLVNFHVPGFNLFVGTDHMLGKTTKEGVPLSSNGTVNIGMNFPF